MGGAEEVWGKQQRAELRELLGFGDASSPVSERAGGSETVGMAAPVRVADVKQVVRETMEVSKLDAAFEALNEKGVSPNASFFSFDPAQANP